MSTHSPASLTETENVSVDETAKHLSDEELAKLIQLPPKVFQELLQEFGRDEVIALVINVLATSATNALGVGGLLLAASGPLAEKAGLFLYPSLRQYLTQKNLPSEERVSLLQNLAKIWDEGRATLARDVFLHDPIYTALLLLELQKLPDLPVELLSAIAFTISIISTVGIEIAGRELLYHLQLEQFKRQGFVLEELYESRVLLLAHPSEAQKILQEVQQEFGFPHKVEANYLDTYYEEKSGQNGRKSKLRHRIRTEVNQAGSSSESASVQMVFEKLTKDDRGFFPTSKDKLRLVAGDPRYETYLEELQKNEPIKQIACTRWYMQTELGIYVSFDQFGLKSSAPTNDQDGDSTLTIEVKAHRQTPEAVRLQQEIIYFLTSRHPQQIAKTNHPKNQMLS